MNTNPLITIVAPMYRVEQYVGQCIKSLISQTYKNLEIILVDDGSPDKSGEIADEYALKDHRIKVIHQENKRLGGARNTGLEIAKGDFITFVDSDDYLSEDFVEYMLSLIEKTGAEMAISRNCFTSYDNQQVSYDSVSVMNSDDAVAEFFYPRITLGTWNKMYDMRFLKKHQFEFVPELKTGEGLEFITRVAAVANKIAVGNRKVYCYRLDNVGSATTKANVERQGKGCLETMDYIKSHLEMPSQKVQKAYNWHLWSCHAYCLTHIIESGSSKEYSDLYRKCITHLRKKALFVFFADIDMKQRIKVFLTFVSPVIMTKMHIWNKRRKLRKK